MLVLFYAGVNHVANVRISAMVIVVTLSLFLQPITRCLWIYWIIFSIKHVLIVFIFEQTERRWGGINLWVLIISIYYFSWKLCVWFRSKIVFLNWNVYERVILFLQKSWICDKRCQTGKRTRIWPFQMIWLIRKTV